MRMEMECVLVEHIFTNKVLREVPAVKAAGTLLEILYGGMES